MGWTYTRKENSMSIKEFFQREFGDSVEILDCAVVRLRTAYMACKDKAGNVFGVVCLLDYQPNDYYNFGYKDMSEECGPHCYDCPERILKLLTPTQSEWANEWRQRCWENVKKKKSLRKIKNGTVIKFKQPIRFSGGVYYDTFQLVRHGRRTLFKPVSNSGVAHLVYYRIRNWREREFEVVS